MVLLSLTSALAGIASTSYQQVLLDIKNDFSVSWWLVTFSVSSAHLATAIGRLFMGWIIDRWGERRIIVPSVLFFVLGALVAFYTPNIYWLIAGVFIQSLGIAPITIVTTTLISSLFSKDVIGRKIATSQTISWIGPLAGPLIGAYLAYYAGWRTVFIAHILLGILLLLPWLIRKTFLIPATVRPHAQTNKVKNNKLIWISLVGGLQFFVLFASHTLVPILVRDHLGLDARYAGWVSLSLGIVSMMTFSLGGKLSDRIGPTYTTCLGIFVLHSAQVLLLLTTITSETVTGITALLAGSFLLGLSSGLSLPAHLKLIVDFFPDNKASALGFYKLVQYIGGAAGPACMGLAIVPWGPFWTLIGFLSVSITLTIPSLRGLGTTPSSVRPSKDKPISEKN
ncbi:hypothetical protein GCM10008018_61390 [Paenibacillus marchantiophytorum]|uniref:Major facilitator superfamily (MFS) profile domain-containing protein n=2 Tax=Paenibacillus marchantiophytorum TaxID=1619310 RepID=A0ABQ1FE25_9BACL|nr:hypothetical protein GCM10008018_61390 [Paenibacillus marchantiophytorum]